MRSKLSDVLDYKHGIKSKHEYKTREPGLPISDFWLFLIYLLIYLENVYGHSSHSWWLQTAYKNKTPMQKTINPYT